MAENPYQGLAVLVDHANPHVGGNIREGDPFTFCPTVWDYVLKRFAVRSVLDLGSGIGHASRYFRSQGCDVIAVDGMRENIERAVVPTVFWDATLSAVHCRVDLVHCHEVVEHIEERHINNLLDSLCCGQYILMTHALPGQGGHHHVNEQPASYWIAHLHRRGCEILPPWPMRRQARYFNSQWRASAWELVRRGVFRHR